MSQLDSEELYSLAMKASQEGDSDKAIRYFKESLESNPTPEAYYLLGAEYASLKMYARAVESMEAALAQRPELHTARIQIALIHLITNMSGAAAEALAPLSELDEAAYLRMFGEGLTALIEERIDDARALLLMGIQANEENPALNGDMQKILAHLGGGSGDQPNADEADAELGDAASRYLMSNYQKTN